MTGHLSDKTLDEWGKLIKSNMTPHIPNPGCSIQAAWIIFELISAIRESREEVKALREALEAIMKMGTGSQGNNIECGIAYNALAWKPSEEEFK